MILLESVLDVGGQDSRQVATRYLSQTQFELETELEEIVRQLVGDEGDVYNICERHVAVRVRRQVKIVQERGKKHLETKLEVIIAMAKQEETEVVLEECCVGYERHGVRIVFILS